MKTVKEAAAKIEELEERIEALENPPTQSANDVEPISGIEELSAIIRAIQTRLAYLESK